MRLSSGEGVDGDSGIATSGSDFSRVESSSSVCSLGMQITNERNYVHINKQVIS